MSDCETIAGEQALADYFAAELAAEAEKRLEDHVFDCSSCASRFESAGALSQALREAIPPVITHEKLERLERLGWPIQRIPIAADTNVDAHFSSHLRLLIFAMQGEVASDERADLEACNISGQTLAEVPGVPVDRATGEVLIACQKHYRETFPAEIRFRIWAVRGDVRRRVGEYVVNHTWD